MHQWLWDKWGYVKDIAPFRIGGDVEQEPGILRDDVTQALQGIMDSMPSKTKYPKKA